MIPDDPVMATRPRFVAELNLAKEHFETEINLVTERNIFFFLN